MDKLVSTYSEPIKANRGQVSKQNKTNHYVSHCKQCQSAVQCVKDGSHSKGQGHIYINKSKPLTNKQILQNESNPAGPLGGPEGPQWYSFPQELEKARKAGYFSIILKIYDILCCEDRWSFILCLNII